jgi:hypothetical protein
MRIFSRNNKILEPRLFKKVPSKFCGEEVFDGKYKIVAEAGVTEWSYILFGKGLKEKGSSEDYVLIWMKHNVLKNTVLGSIRREVLEELIEKKKNKPDFPQSS